MVLMFVLVVTQPSSGRESSLHTATTTMMTMQMNTVKNIAPTLNVVQKLMGVMLGMVQL